MERPFGYEPKSGGSSPSESTEDGESSAGIGGSQKVM